MAEITGKKPSEFSEATINALKEVLGLKTDWRSYKALLTDMHGDHDFLWTPAPLIIDNRYVIFSYASGDDFTNVGIESNVTGVEFWATGTTPSVWSNGSVLINLSKSLLINVLNRDEQDFAGDFTLVRRQSTGKYWLENNKFLKNKTLRFIGSQSSDSVEPGYLLLQEGGEGIITLECYNKDGILSDETLLHTPLHIMVKLTFDLVTASYFLGLDGFTGGIQIVFNDPDLLISSFDATKIEVDNKPSDFAVTDVTFEYSTLLFNFTSEILQVGDTLNITIKKGAFTHVNGNPNEELMIVLITEPL